MEFQDVAWLVLAAVELDLCEYDLLRSFIKSRVFQSNFLCVLRRDKFRCSELLLLLLQYDTQHCINAVHPLCFRVGKDKPVVGCFNSAGNQLLCREDHLHIDSCIFQGNFLRFGKSDKFPGVNNAAVLGVYLVRVLFLCGMEFQDVAWLVLAAVELFFGEYDLLSQLIQFGIFQSNFLCFIQRDELRYTDRYNVGSLLEFKKFVQRHAGNLIRGQPGFI